MRLEVEDSPGTARGSIKTTMDPFLGARVRMDKWGEVVAVYFFDGGFLGVLVVFPVEVEGVEASAAALAAAATEINFNLLV